MTNNQHTKNPDDTVSENHEDKNSARQVVDDECSIRQTLQDLFLDAGYECDEAENGEEALKLINSCEYDLILSDIMMPKMSGVILFQNVRMMHYVTNFIFITGCNIMECDKKTIAEADKVFTKPVSLQELMTHVNNLSAKKKA